MSSPVNAQSGTQGASSGEGGAKSHSRKPIGEILVGMGLLKAEALDAALKRAVSQGMRVGELLIKESVIKEADLAQALAVQYDLEYMDLEIFVPSQAALKLLPEKAARANMVLPIEVNKKGELVLAVHDPLDFITRDVIRKVLSVGYVVRVTTLSRLKENLERAYSSAHTIDGLVEHLAKEESLRRKPDQKIVHDGAEVSKLSVEGLVSRIIEAAVTGLASDIHMDPAEDLVRIRYRIDGVLHVVNTYPSEIHPVVVSRIKILARMDISEKRNPQDGRFQHHSRDQWVDIRASTLPLVNGEKVVLRLMSRTRLRGSLEAVGMPTVMIEKIEWLLHRPFGMLLVTGPTGSGKTTSMYSMVNRINGSERNIITVEDPVEYRLDMVNQVQVNEKAGLNFAGILRNILRQDPDVIMVGEVRDQETADIAIRAALTGHLVLSTLHTNDSVSTPTRLVDMDVEPFLISSALLAVLSQRLVRILCKHCRKKTALTAAEIALLGDQSLQEGAEVYAHGGCERCFDSGYFGRVGLFELMVPDRAVQKFINERKSEADILSYLLENGFKTMRQDGISKILNGTTSVEEVIKTTF